MTFCIGVRVNEGIVALADTRIVKGGERLSKAKLALHLAPGGSYFTMTSGLRSVRDKMLIYGEESIMRSAEPLTRLYQVVNLLGEELRRVKREDGPSLQASHLDFNLHAIVGGRLSEDPRPTMFLIYPEGNWIEVNDDSPYFMIGRTPFGRPILDRHLHSQRPLKMATALALLAFDMTASSVTDVDYPIDVAMMRRDQFEFAQHRYEHADLQAATSHWYNAVAQSLLTMPTHWLTPFDPQL